MLPSERMYPPTRSAVKPAPPSRARTPATLRTVADDLGFFLLVASLAGTLLALVLLLLG